ncbi:MAG: autotransporter domain-containing protein [Pseudomonadota bacterium]
MALAQDVSTPAPTPTPVPFPDLTIPDAPLNAQECAFDAVPTPSTLVCAPGTDADGFQQNSDDVDVSVEAGAQVQGEIQLGNSVVVLNNGDIVVDSGTNAIDLGDDATIVNNGLVNADPFFDAIISVDDRADITNNGTITAIGNDFVAGLFIGSDSTVVNDGLIALDGNGNVGILGGIGPSSTGVSVINTENGQIIMDGHDIGIAVAIGVSDDSVIVNEGLIQVEGPTSSGVFAGANSSVTNSGDILINGEGSAGIVGVDSLTLDNSGFIIVTGDGSPAVISENDLTFTNSGTIEATGAAIETGDESSITNELGGTIATTGAANTIDAGANLTVLNSGTIRNQDVGAAGVSAGDGLALTNSGAIEATGSAVETGDGASITNELGNTIVTTGEADTIEAGANLTLINNGTIRNEGLDTKNIDAGDGLSVTNNGTITSDSKGIEGEADFTLTNSAGALVFSASDEAVEADGPGLVVINDGEIIAPLDDAIDGGDNVTITNTGLIQGSANDAIELNSGTITNSGTIESLSSDPDGDFLLDGEGNPTADREIDAAIDFDGGTNGNEDGTVTNLAGGVIIGDIGINTSSGATGANANGGAQTIVNFGTITGRATNPETGRQDAVVLGEGDDTFQQWQTGVTNGAVDGQGGNDTLIFGNDTEEAITRSLTAISDPAQYAGFETVAFLDVNGAGINLTGDTDQTLTVLGGTIGLQGNVAASIDVQDVSMITIDAAGSVVAADEAAITFAANGSTLVNAGTIQSSGERAIDARGLNATQITNSGTIAALADGGGVGNGETAIDVSGSDGVTISNSGAILASADDADAISGGANMTLTNSGTITAQGANGVAVDVGAGSSIDNTGAITATGDAGTAIILADMSDLLNASDASVTVSGVGATAVLAGSDTAVTNAGMIEATGDGSQAITAAGDFALTNTGVISATGGGVDVAGLADITNEEGGVIAAGGAYGVRFGDASTLTNRGDISGETGVIGSAGDDFVANFGAITGTTNGVSLGEGEDEFQQWTGASVAGNVALGGGNDTLILEGASSSVTGTIDGGAGVDGAILAGVLDSDNLVGFETYQLGSTLGGTLDDVDVVGARTLDGDVVQTGIVNLGLGVDSLTATGSITLEEGAVINIATPLDEELVGQEVLVLQEGTTFTDNGATINIIDDDLLLEYTPVLGSLSVQVNFVDPLLEANTTDPNINNLGNAVSEAFVAGTLAAGNFAVLNEQPDADAYTAVLKDSLPSLSDGVGREIFESGNLATQALERHLAGDEPGAWGQIAVRGAQQDALGQSVDGYDSDQTVFTIGSDIMPGDSFRLGALLSYADINVDDETSTGAPTNDQSVESYRIGGYLSVKLGERGFSNTEVSYLTGSVDSRRVGALGLIQSGYDFDGIAARSVFGYDVLPDENVSLTPTLGFNAAQINFDDAIEAGGFNFTVEQGDARFFEGRLGAELGARMSEKVSGFIQGTVVRDFEGSERTLRLNSAELPTFLVTQPVRERNRFELAAGANVDVSENFSIEVGYLGDFNDGYSGHSARASARIAF